VKNLLNLKRGQGNFKDSEPKLSSFKYNGNIRTGPKIYPQTFSTLSFGQSSILWPSMANKVLAFPTEVMTGNNRVAAAS